ncbi:MAG: alpha/beta hydrolase [Fibrobacter sp.]|nr:alpha/beta hydrolase [Fibrobacter sp.]
MKKIAVYIHGKGGNVAEADHYKSLLNDYEVVGFDYKAETPWEAVTEFRAFFASLEDYDSVLLITNSIGAYFAMMVLGGDISSSVKIERALFISPVVDMEKLICDMMRWANVTEDELRESGEIPTDFGETLSWKYLSYVREHPVRWNIPSEILYGSKDSLTPYEVVRDFADKTSASLTVMDGGEHWFHTPEQMKFLDQWIESRAL